MAIIKPVSYLRNNFADVSSMVHESAEPVYLTKNGYGDMVVMSIETYEKALYDAEIYLKLKEAELEMKTEVQLKPHDEVFSGLYAKYGIKGGDENL